ncbi:MAG: hypothetical protein DWQ29_01915 [Planctomycetota bacterium]|nr:MAG: hypothetical protein DWQ29_01915 [Planctomycetota bacterium]
MNQAEPAESYLSWMIQSLGVYAIILPFLGLVLFGGGCLVVAMSKRPSVIAACLAFVPFPLLIGLFGFFDGAIASFKVIANSPVAPAPKDLAAGISTALFVPFTALLVTMPGYLVLACGLLWRTIASGRGAQSDRIPGEVNLR